MRSKSAPLRPETARKDVPTCQHYEYRPWGFAYTIATKMAGAIAQFAKPVD
jgi:hypothetical protein